MVTVGFWSEGTQRNVTKRHTHVATLAPFLEQNVKKWLSTVYNGNSAGLCSSLTFVLPWAIKEYVYTHARMMMMIVKKDGRFF
jgi:hypothetical protein